jgi:uncharacterized protein
VTMELIGNALRARIYIGESDRWKGKPLHTAIVEEARRSGLAGATVLRGMEGYGANSVIHTSRILAMSTDLPVVIEIVDARPKLHAFLPSLMEMVDDGLVTVEPVEVLHYRSSLPDEESED